MLFDAIASVALGIPGSYSLYGIPVTFIDKGTSPIRKLALGVIGGDYINTFVHELGHSLADRYFCGVFGKIFVNSDTSGSCTIKKLYYDRASDLEHSFISLSGPLLEISFGLLTSLIVHKIYKRTFKHRRNPFHLMVMIILKVQNVFTVMHPMLSPMDLFFKSNDNSDFMKIHRFSGTIGAVLSSTLMLSIGLLALKIIYTIPEIKENPPTLMERIDKIIKNITECVPSLHGLGQNHALVAHS